MFIREVTKTAKGKKYIQHQLIEAIRTPMGPRQRLILNLGRINLPKEQWKALANAIESEYKKQPTLIGSDKKIQKLARHYATLISQNTLNKAQDSDTEDEITVQKSQKAAYKADYETVDLNSMEYSNAKTVGGEQVILSQLREYGLDKFLKDLGLSSEQVKIAEAQIVSRAVHPASEKETARWLNENSGTKELVGIDKNMYDNALHRVAHDLLDHKVAIEDELAQKAKEHFGLEEKIILYDLTNSFFAGSKRKSQIAKPGRSKEKRHDRPLVSVALRVDERGFPKGSEILPGNVSEPETLGKVLETLRETEPLLTMEKTIVIDAGIASDENLKLIRKYGFHYVAVSRQRTFPEDFWKKAKEKELPLPSDKKNPLKVKLIRTGTEAFLHCKSKSKEAKGRAILEGRQTKFETEIASLKEGLEKPKCLKQYDKVLQKIGVLKERYKVGNLYEIEVEKEIRKATKKGGESKILATKIKLQKNKQGEVKEEGLGEYVIRTDRLDLSELEISQLHRSLTTVEASFRSMKSELGLRPNYHKLDRNMEAHIFITILAYHILAATIAKLEEAGIYYEWKTIRNILSSHTRVSSSMRSEDNHIIHMRGTSVANIEQIEIYNGLKMKHDLLGRQKMKIPLITPKKEKAAKCSDEKITKN